MTKDFTIEQILSVVTERLLCKDMHDIYLILEYMTGEDVQSHQVVRTNMDCKNELLRQYPIFTGINGDNINPDNCQKWIADAKKLYGESLTVKPIANYPKHNPLQEMTDKAGDKVIVVIVS